MPRTTRRMAPNPLNVPLRDGRVAITQVIIDFDSMQLLTERARDNRYRKATRGPVTVKILRIEERPAPAPPEVPGT